MLKYARVNIDGVITWVELGDNIVQIMDGTPLDKTFTRKTTLDFNPESLHYLSPTPTIPSKVIGLGWNYKDLVGEKTEYKEPIIFLKSRTSICPHKSKVRYPSFAQKVWVEVELVIVIGKICSNISAEEAEEYIMGYTIGSDITALNIHERDWHLARSKAIDGFAPIGPNLIKGLDTANVWLKSYINGKEAQCGNTADRIINDAELVSLISGMITLLPGDIIFTGTPAKATEAIVVPGDFIEHEIENIGTLSFNIE